MEGKEITIVSCESGDWCGLYVEGVLEIEGHSLLKEDFINLIRKYKVFKDVIHFVISEEHMEWLGGNFPSKLQDVNYIDKLF